MARHGRGYVTRLSAPISRASPGIRGFFRGSHFVIVEERDGMVIEGEALALNDVRAQWSETGQIIEGQAITGVQASEFTETFILVQGEVLSGVHSTLFTETFTLIQGELLVPQPRLADYFKTAIIIEGEDLLLSDVRGQWSETGQVIEGNDLSGVDKTEFIQLVREVIEGEDFTPMPRLAEYTEAAIVIEGENLSGVHLTEWLKSQQIVEGEELVVQPRLFDFFKTAIVIEGQDLQAGVKFVEFLEAVREVVQGEDLVLNDIRLQWTESGLVIEGNDAAAAPQIIVTQLTVPVIEGEDLIGFGKAFQFSFAGVTRDQNGTPLGGCTVWLFRTSDRTPLAVTTSDGSGNYSFSLTSDPIEYFARAHLDAPARVFGTTDRNLLVDEIQIYP